MKRLIAVAAGLVVLTGCSSKNEGWTSYVPLTAAPPAENVAAAPAGVETSAAEGVDSGFQELTCPAVTVAVSTADELTEALAAAAPGDVIGLADGTYAGNFTAAVPGSVAEPIWLCGGRDAVLDAGGPKEGYVLHLDGASYWRVVGFTVQNGQKGVMADGVVGSVIQGLHVTGIGDEAIHLRRFSSDNVVAFNEVDTTGLRRDKFGEGIYVGTATSNWGTISGGEPDTSDRNAVIGNVISATSAESVDIKEGTTGGVVLNNTFDGSGMTGADSWVDIKGNNWLIEGNYGTNSPLDGFQTHEVEEGWGAGNTFSSNTAIVDADGFGFAFRPARGNIVTCDNTVTGAESGYATQDCAG